MRLEVKIAKGGPVSQSDSHLIGCLDCFLSKKTLGNIDVNEFVEAVVVGICKNISTSNPAYVTLS